MKKILSAGVIGLMLLSSCEVEVRDGHHYDHARGWEHQHYPEHHRCIIMDIIMMSTDMKLKYIMK